jgi:hypothetical protein
MREAAAKRETAMRERRGDVLRPMVAVFFCEAVGLGLVMRRLGHLAWLERHVRPLYIPPYSPSHNPTPSLKRSSPRSPREHNCRHSMPSSYEKPQASFLPDLIRVDELSTLGITTFSHLPTVLPIVPWLDFCTLPSRTTHMAANVEVECGVL